MKEKENTLYCDMAGEDQLYILTPNNMDRYLEIFDGVHGDMITWKEYKTLLDNERKFNYIYNEWLIRNNEDLVDLWALFEKTQGGEENLWMLIEKIQKGIDISSEDNYKKSMDELMPDIIEYSLSTSLGNDPGEYLYDSLPRDIVDEYIVEGTCGGPGCASVMEYLEYGRKDEIVEELQSRGYKVIEVRMLPF